MLLLKRHQLFLTGVAIVCFCYLCSKAFFLIGSATTQGSCNEYDIIYPEGKTKDPDRFFPIIDYTVDGKAYQLTGVENLKLKPNEKVTVIYKRNNPVNAYQFSFFGFWYYGILYSALATILLTITCYGIFEKGQTIRIRVPFIKFNTGGENSKNKPGNKQLP